MIYVELGSDVEVGAELGERREKEKEKEQGISKNENIVRMR